MLLVLRCRAGFVCEVYVRGRQQKRNRASFADCLDEAGSSEADAAVSTLSQLAIDHYLHALRAVPIVRYEPHNNRTVYGSRGI